MDEKTTYIWIYPTLSCRVLHAFVAPTSATSRSLCGRFPAPDWGMTVGARELSPKDTCKACRRKALIECVECEGLGEVPYSHAQAGDQTLEEWLECGLCDGTGRVLA